MFELSVTPFIAVIYITPAGKSQLVILDLLACRKSGKAAEHTRTQNDRHNDGQNSLKNIFFHSRSSK